MFFSTLLVNKKMIIFKPNFCSLCVNSYALCLTDEIVNSFSRLYGDNGSVELTPPQRAMLFTSMVVQPESLMLKVSSHSSALQSLAPNRAGIIQCAQCARAHEAPPYWRPHHRAHVKIIVMRKFVIEVWLKCVLK